MVSPNLTRDPWFSMVHRRIVVRPYMDSSQPRDPDVSAQVPPERDRPGEATVGVALVVEVVDWHGGTTVEPREGSPRIRLKTRGRCLRLANWTRAGGSSARHVSWLLLVYVAREQDASRGGGDR